MQTVQIAKYQRNQALQVLKLEQQLLLDIRTAATNRFERPQRLVVNRAKARYDRLNDFLKTEISKTVGSA